MRKLGSLAPVAPAHNDLEAASRALQADLMAQARLDIRRWDYAPATTVHRMVADGVAVVEFTCLVDEFGEV